MKQQQLAALNTELSKINSSRRESVVDTDDKVRTVDVTTLAPPIDVEKKERRISRFKVSVVTEPDPTKLAVPEKTNNKNECDGAVVGVINDAYKSLEKVVDSCYSIKPGLCFVCFFVVVVVADCFVSELVAATAQASTKTVMFSLCFVFFSCTNFCFVLLRLCFLCCFCVVFNIVFVLFCFICVLVASFFSYSRMQRLTEAWWATLRLALLSH